MSHKEKEHLRKADGQIGYRGNKGQELHQLIGEILQPLLVFLCLKALSGFQIIVKFLLAIVIVHLSQELPFMNTLPENSFREKRSDESDSDEKSPSNSESEPKQQDTPITPPITAAPVQYVAINQQNSGYNIDKFSGNNISQFLEEYDTLADIYLLQGLNKIRTMIAYCTPRFREIIKVSKPYEQAMKDHDWKKFREGIAHKFRHADTARLEVSIDQLDYWLSECQSQDELDIQSYLDEYELKSARCLNAQTMVRGHRGFYFAKGLPTYWRNMLIKDLKLNSERRREFDYDTVSEYISTMAELRTAGDRIMTSHRKVPGKQPVLWAKPQTASDITTRLFQPKKIDPPTQAEVDDLVEKYANLQIQGIQLASASWTTREQVLLENKDVAAHVQREGANKSQSVQKPYSFLQNFQTPTNTFRPETQYQGSQQQSSPNTMRRCHMCDSLSHIRTNCPTTQQLVDNGWIHQNDAGYIQWGRADRPQGRIRELSGAQTSWKDIICSQIKTRWLRADMNPLTTMANWDDIQKGQHQPAQTNSIGAIAHVDTQSGLLSREEYDAFWHNNVVDNDDSEPEMNAAAIARPQRAAKPIIHRPVGDVRVTKPLKDEEKLTIQPRGTRLKHPEDFHPAGPKHDRKSPLHPQPTRAELEEAMRRMPTQPKEPVPRGPRKPRFIDSLQSTTSQQVSTLMGSPVTVTVEDILRNMPEVQKYIFKQPTPVQTSSIGLEDESDDEDEPRISLAGVNGISTEAIPDYVIVDATAQGQVTRCASVAADHWTDPEMSHIMYKINSINQHAPMDDLYDEPPQTTRNRREYDKQAGVEHIRRSCPKFPISLPGGSTMKALLDTGAELNTMTRAAADDAMLPIATLPFGMKNAMMVSANGSAEHFVGVVWGVNVEVGSISVRTNFFILNELTNPVILGNPFLADARARIEYSSNGQTYCRIWEESGEASTRFVCMKGNQMNPRGTVLVQAMVKGKGVC